MDDVPDDDAALWAAFLALGEVPDDDFDQDRADALVHHLNERGDAQVVDWALPLLTDPSPWHREAAAWVIRQHGFRLGRPFAARAMPGVVSAARVETDPGVRAELVAAIGWSELPELAPELMRYADDPHADVRWQVAANLASIFSGEEPSPEAISCLVELSRDADPAVRNWAVFSLGSLSDADGPEIRQAFVDRLGDGDASDASTDELDASAEAARGLARRHDPAVLPWLVSELGRPEHEVGNLVVEAAGELGDPTLLPALLALRDAGWHLNSAEPLPGVLQVAIDSLTR